MIRALVVILFVSLISPLVVAQPVRFQHLTLDDGLSQDIITTIAQDDQGFMWFGTEDGLNRYDGYSVKVYKHDPRDSATLVDKNISCLLPDHHGHLWVGTGQGAEMFDLRNQTFHHFSVTADGPPASTTSFYQDSDSSFWIGTSSGLFRYANGCFTQAVVEHHRFTTTVWSLYGEKKMIWVVESVGLRCYTTSQESLRTVALPPEIRALDGVGVTHVFRDSERRFWVSTGHKGIFRFDSTMHFVRHYGEDARDPTALKDGRMRLGIEDHSGTIWFGTMSGLERFEPSLDGFTHFQEDPANPSGLIGSRVYSLYADRTGILWVGTYRGAVNTYAPAREKFRLFIPDPATKAEDVYAINESREGDVLAGTDHGLFHVRESVPGATWIPYAGNEGQPVFVILRRRNGELWSGTYSSIERLSTGSGGSMRIGLPVNDPVHLLFEDNDGQLWVGTDTHGLFVIDKTTWKVTAWSPPGEQYSDGAWAMFQDRRQDLWIGTWAHDYFYRYDKRHGAIQRFGVGRLATVFLPYTSVRSFREDAAGTLWLGLWGGGVYHLDSLLQPVQRLTEFDGLANDFVKSMEIDQRGRLWIGTERGLSRFDPATGAFKTFTKRDGLPSNFFYSGSSFKSPKGTLFFGCQGGFVSFDPDSIPHNANPPPVVITGVRVLDRPLPPAAWSSDKEEIPLRHDQDFFSFEFVALDFTAPERNQYSYKLEGFDRGWIQAGTRRYAAYTHLDPGTYIFRVKGSNNDGVWNEEGAAITIVIAPPFWQTWWFRAGIAAVMVIAIYTLYRYRLGKVLEVERLRQRIARDLHDDIGTNLSAIVLASQMAGHEDIPPAFREYADDMRSVALETQEHMRDIVWMLNPRNDSLELLVRRMKDDAARLFPSLHYSFQSPQGLPEKIDLTLKRNIFLIYKEALHNIVKHSRATEVDIRVGFEQGVFRLQMRDNGRGFDPSNVVPGNGLDSMKSRAEQMGATLQIQAAPGEGTSVQLEVKIT